jgi:hypothetical protein
MPDHEFEKRSAHGKKRVAWIDPSLTLDDHTDFKLCHGEDLIYDYYNSGGLAQHGESKKEMVRNLMAQIDRKKLFDESGFLAFRFVVNCEGKAGRFITEETDLDFGRKKFNPQTVAHLYQLVYALQDWKPVVVGESRDAYFYLTFKMNHGEVTDILP